MLTIAGPFRPIFCPSEPYIGSAAQMASGKPTHRDWITGTSVENVQRGYTKAGLEWCRKRRATWQRRTRRTSRPIP